MKRPGRLLATVALVLGLGLTAGCTEGTQVEDTQISDETIIQTLGDWTTAWLQDLRGPSAAQLDCPGAIYGSFVTSNSGDARGCLRTPDNVNVYLRVQNLTRVPLTINFAATWYTLLPGATQDYLLINPRYNQTVRFSRDLRTAVGSAMLDYVRGVQTPSLKWASCVEGLSVDCILTGLESVLPETITIRGEEIPAKKIVEVIHNVWTYEPLVNTFSQQARGTGSGTLTFVSVCSLFQTC